METEVESMVNVPIQQVSSSVPLLILQSSISHLLNHSGPGPQLLTPRTISSGLVPQPPSPTPNVPPTKNDWDLLFCPMLDEYFNPSTSTSQTTQEEQSHVIPTSVEEDDHGIEVAHMDNDLVVPHPPSPTPNVPPTKNDCDLLFCPMLDEYFNPSTSTLQTTQEEQSHVIPTSVEEDDHGIEVAHMDNDLISAGRYLLQTLGQEKLEFLMKKVGMQSMSLETMKKLADETEELW
ncbi:hypothetical protein Tco_1382322, partial [Tanacetum coccineum]